MIENPAHSGDAMPLEQGLHGARAATEASKRAIILAGCLAMVYMHLTTGAHQDAYLRSLGARDMHFGVLGAIPPSMLLAQFLGALAAARLRRRKPLWMTMIIAARLMLVPVALIPWLMPNSSPGARIWTLLGLMAVSEALHTFSQPLFFAWMGALLPHKSLGAFWARRRGWLSATQTAAMGLAAIAFFRLREQSPHIMYVIVALPGVLAGVLDILLFTRIPEPRHPIDLTTRLTQILAPFRSPDFRRFLVYTVAWSFSASLAYPFMRIYLLTEIGLPVYTVTLLFMAHAFGGVFFAQKVGELTDLVGSRPMILLCTLLKSLITIGMLSARPSTAIWVLLPILMIDNIMNTGLIVGRDGFMLKQAPPRNRAMYVAAVLATAGLAATLGSLSGGLMLESLPSAVPLVAGISLSPYRVLFLVSTIARLLSILPAYRIREHQSVPAREVFLDVIGPSLIRWVRFPLGLLVEMPRQRKSNDQGKR